MLAQWLVCLQLHYVLWGETTDMRLIDLDDALESIQREIGNVACPNTVLYVLENRPQVEAIPVEWIEEWGWKNGMSESMSLRVMIDDWEKRK